MDVENPVAQELSDLAAKALTTSQVPKFEDLSKRENWLEQRFWKRFVSGTSSGRGGNHTIKEKAASPAKSKGEAVSPEQSESNIEWSDDVEPVLGVSLSTASTRESHDPVVYTYKKGGGGLMNSSSSVSSVTFQEGKYLSSDSVLPGVRLPSGLEEEIVFEPCTPSNQEQEVEVMRTVLGKPSLSNEGTGATSDSKVTPNPLLQHEREGAGAPMSKWRFVLKKIQMSCSKRKKQEYVDMYGVMDSNDTMDQQWPDAQGFTPVDDHRRMKARLLYASLALFCIGGIVGIVLLVVDGKRRAELRKEHDDSVPKNTTTVHNTTIATTERYEDFRNIVGSVSGFQSLEDVEGPASRALDWLAKTDLIASTASYQTISQRYIMALLYFSTGGTETWIHQHDFLSGKSICEWGDGYDVADLIEGTTGIECQQDDTILGIQLRGNELAGTIPSEIFSIKSLKRLQLDRNKLSGSFPTQLGLASKLELMQFANNKLDGIIPTEIGSLTALTQLDLSQNQLISSLPTELSHMSNLQTLSLYANQLTGTVPEVIGLNLQSLQVLNLRSNKLTGVLDDAAFCHYAVFMSDCGEGDNLDITGVERIASCPCCTQCCDSHTCCDSMECCQLDESLSCNYGLAPSIPEVIGEGIAIGVEAP